LEEPEDEVSDVAEVAEEAGVDRFLVVVSSVGFWVDVAWGVVAFFFVGVESVV